MKLRRIVWVVDKHSNTYRELAYARRLRVGLIKQKGFTAETREYTAVNIIAKEQVFSTVEEAKIWIEASIVWLVDLLTEKE